MAYQDTDKYKEYQRNYQRKYAHRPREKERRKLYELKYRENPEVKEHRREKKLAIYHNNPLVRKRMSVQHREYRSENKDKIKNFMVEYRKKNREYLKKTSKEKALKYINSWKKVIPQKFSCEICGREVIFDSKIRNKSMVFDHRNGGDEVIKGSPNGFFWSRPATSKNIAIFESCEFGILCCTCNHHLPTKNRIEWIEKAIKYARKSVV